MLARFQSDPTSAGAADAASYVQTNLVSDVNGLAKATDPNLVNPWGVSFRNGSPFWISDQGSNSATLYSVDGSTGTDVNNPVPVFTVHIPTTLTGPQGPTGQVSNTNDSSFKLTDPLSDQKTASFIFADLNGEISAWNPSLGTDGSTASVEVTTPGAVYTGLAVNEAHTMLYAANDQAGTIDVFNSMFAPVNLGDHAFRTPGEIAARGLVPFNATDIGGEVYVTYAPSGRAAQTTADEGDGAVAIFSESGKLEPHGVLLGGPHTPLAAPWGVAIAPDNFGQFSDDLLVGNFSFQHSEINAFDPQTHKLVGTIPISAGSGQTPGGLWTLTFGGGGRDGSPNTLYFTDGIDGEAHGLFGAITSSAAKTIAVTDPPASGASGPPTNTRGLSDLISQFVSNDTIGAPDQLSGGRVASLTHTSGPLPDIAALTEHFMGAPFVSGGALGLLPSSLTTAEEHRALLAFPHG
ncbi:TIGR03118 family protein [Bradyrhizobium sp. NAS80.1]|uniref:TIGR03118 family protein n=1 Tax=Bradyrhizobium sp. NAS80.1 TaxID=1680159 RepID=UPI0009FBADF5|nr:TIGR03118 family protein [Bradyrhizobium sp. NAS80.1]